MPQKNFKAINNKHYTHKRKCLSFLIYLQIKSEAKNTGPRDQVYSTKTPVATGIYQIPCLPIQSSDLSDYFWRVQPFQQSHSEHFIYTKALPKGSLLNRSKDLSAGDSSSVVVEGQSDRFQANPFQQPILQRTQCIQDPGASTEVWVSLGQKWHKGKTEKWRLPKASNLWSNTAPIPSMDWCTCGATQCPRRYDGKNVMKEIRPLYLSPV